MGDSGQTDQERSFYTL